MANTPFSSTTSAETRYTPPKRAGVANDGNVANAVPRKFQANPVKSVARRYSISAQSPASAKRHTIANSAGKRTRSRRRHSHAAQKPKSAM